jgi:hypothetical protein
MISLSMLHYFVWSEHQLNFMLLFWAIVFLSFRFAYMNELAGREENSSTLTFCWLTETGSYSLRFSPFPDLDTDVNISDPNTQES